MQGWKDLYKRHSLLTWLVGIGIITQLLTSTKLVAPPSRDDTWVHYSFSIIVSQMVFAIIEEFAQLKDKAGNKSQFTAVGVLLITFLGGITIGVLWEITEYALDHMAGLHFQHGNSDTMGDLIADTLGSLTGGLVAIYGPRLLEKLRP